jgi:hypothetical protein
LKVYDKKLELGAKGKELDAKDKKHLEVLEDSLILESILDARNVCLEKIKPVPVASTLLKSVSAADPIADQRPLTYVEFRLVLYFPLISLRLRNAGYDILKVDFKNIESRLDMRPVANSVYFLLNTRGIDVFGVYYESSIKSGNNSLVPVVKSSLSSDDQINNDKGLFNVADDSLMSTLVSEDARGMLFTFCFESNPIDIKNVEFSIRARFSQAEIFYEKTAITELLRFFKTDLIDFGEVKKIREVWSKAGVIYAVESHKQFHVSAELSSPYFIIPAKGTCTKEGSSIVLFLGKCLK